MSVCTEVGTQNLRFRLDAERALFFLGGWSTGMADFSLPSLVARKFTYVLSDGLLSSHLATCWGIIFRLLALRTPRVYGTGCRLELVHV